jgi:hypothetical protein
MKRLISRPVITICGLLAIFNLLACCSMNQLRGREFRDRTAAAVVSAPPGAELSNEGWTDVDFHNPIQAVIGIGTAVAREVQASKTRARLDSAMQRVDIPEVVRTETLERGSRTLRYRPVEDGRDADYRFDIEIRKYGIESSSWSTGVRFRLDIRITLRDCATGKEMWRRCFDEKRAVSGDYFGLPDAANNVITLMALSSLTTDRIADGLENLAVAVSDEIVRKLQDDFSDKNR